MTRRITIRKIASLVKTAISPKTTTTTSKIPAKTTSIYVVDYTSGGSKTIETSPTGTGTTKVTTTTRTPTSGGGYSSSTSTQVVQGNVSAYDVAHPTTTIKLPSKTQQAVLLKQQDYYGTLTSATPNLDRLRNISLRKLRESVGKKTAERIAQFRKSPAKAIGKTTEEMVIFPFQVAGGIGIVAGAGAEMKSKRLLELQSQIEKKQKAGKVPVVEEILKAKIGGERGVLRATSDVSTLVSMVPKLPKATILFLSNQPLQKTKKFLMNLPSNLKLSANRVITNIKNNPTEAVSYAMTQYFLFGGKVEGKVSKLKPSAKIEKFIIKDTATKREGFFFKWVSKQKPVLIKFRTQLDTNLKDIRTAVKKAVSKIRRLEKDTSTRIKPRYLDIGDLKIPKPRVPEGIKSVGKELKGGAKTIKKAIEITFRTTGWDTLTLKQQAKLIGKKLNLVSAQADRLVYLLRQSRKIQKPIQDLKLSKKGIYVLNKLNAGEKLTKAEIKLLNTEFRKTTKGLLAKSFFASPSTEVRVSRLGVNRGTAGLVDIFKGNFSLKKGKPQILFFRNQRIQNLPRDLSIIKKKLLSGKTLNRQEALDLLNFQLTKSGRFKPIGFLTREAEVTLAPNEIIKRVRKLGSVRINKVKIPIIEAEVSKIQNKAVSRLMTRFNKGEKLSISELKQLSKGIKRESGFKPNYYYPDRGKPYLNLKSKLVNFSIYFSKKKPIGYFPKGASIYGRGKGSPSYPKGEKGGKYPPSIPRYTKTPEGYFPYVPQYPTKPPARVPPYVPQIPRYAKPKPVVKPKVGFKGKAIIGKKKVQKVGYWVYGLSGGKYVKLNKRPLLKIDALSRGSYAIDRTTAKTFKLVPVLKPKKFGVLLRRERGYYNQTKPKFREYKVKRGAKYYLVLKLIEKRKYGIDTLGEVKGLTLARYLASLKKQKKY